MQSLLSVGSVEPCPRDSKRQPLLHCHKSGDHKSGHRFCEREMLWRSARTNTCCFLPPPAPILSPEVTSPPWWEGSSTFLEQQLDPAAEFQPPDVRPLRPIPLATGTHLGQLDHLLKVSSFAYTNLLPFFPILWDSSHFSIITSFLVYLGSL